MKKSLLLMLALGLLFVLPGCVEDEEARCSTQQIIPNMEKTLRLMIIT
jgi:hypothetical protein